MNDKLKIKSIQCENGGPSFDTIDGFEIVDKSIDYGDEVDFIFYIHKNNSVVAKIINCGVIVRYFE